MGNTGALKSRVPGGFNDRRVIDRIEHLLRQRLPRCQVYDLHIFTAPAPKAAAAAGAVKVNAPMPGNINAIKVNVGQSVKAGDVLLILEAMKMENEIKAPQDGTIASIAVNKGQSVNTGDLMVSMN